MLATVIAPASTPQSVRIRPQPRPFSTQGGVVSVPWIDDGVIAVDVEHPGDDVVEQLFESTRLPGLLDPAGEAVVAGDASR